MHRVCAVRGVLKAAFRLGQISAEQYMRASDLPPIKGESLPAGRSLGDGEIAALFSACDDGTLLGARDGAVLALLRSGMRKAELCSLTMRDYVPAIDETPATIRIIKGKGNRSRYAYLDATADGWVRRWLQLRGDSPGALVTAADRKIVIRRLTGKTIESVCSRRRRLAGVGHFTPHDMRRTAATQLKTAGLDTYDIKEVLGHKDIATTERYFRHDKEAVKRKAAGLLKTPKGDGNEQT